MGESYRGLTIRLGADTTSLQKALKGVNSSLTTTQAQLRRVEKALRFDPESLEAASLKMRELGERTSDARSKMSQLRAAESQMGARGLEAMSDAARNVSLDVERMKENFNEANRRLEVLNRSFREIADSNGIDYAAMDAGELARELERCGLLTDEQVADYRRLAAAHGEYQDALESSKALQRFRDLKVEIELTAAETKSLARQMSDLEARSGLGSAVSAQMRDVRESIRLAGEAGEDLRRELDLIDEGLRLDPTSVALAERRVRNLKEQADLASREVEAVEEAIEGMRSAGVRDTGRDMDDLVKSIARAEEGYVDLRVRVADAEAAVDSLRQAQERMRMDGVGGAEYDEMAADIARAEEELAALNAEARELRTSLDTEMAEKELRELAAQADTARARVAALSAEVTASAKSAGASTWAYRSLAVSLSSSVTPAVMTAAYYVTSAAETFDSAYRDMRKTVNGTEEDFEALRQSALEYSRTHVTSADTILEIEAMGGQLGLAVDQLEEFALVVSNLDIATNLDADELAETLGQLNNVLGWGEGDMTRFSDALVRLGNNMPALEDAIVDITKRIGAAGTMYGMTTPEILSWSTAIAATGQDSEAAGTAISNTLSDIENAVASGGEKLEGFASVAQMGAAEFAELWGADASAALLAFVEGLDAIERAGGSADVALTNLGITGVRQKQAIKGLTMTTDVLNDSLAMSQNAWDGVGDQWGEAGDAAVEAAKKSEGFSGAIAMMRNNLSELAVTVGDWVLPIIEGVTGVLAAANEAAAALPDGLGTAIASAAGLLALAGPIGNVATSLVNVAGGSEAAADGMDGLARRSRLAKAALSALKVVGGIVGTAVLGAIAGKVYEAIESFEDFEDATDGLVLAASGGFRELEESGGSFFSEFTGGYESVADEVDALIEKQAELARAMQEQNREYSAESGLTAGYLATVEGLAELASQGALTEEQTAQMTVALDALNERLGTSYYWDAASGAIRELGTEAEITVGSLQELARAYTLTAGLELAKQQYEDVYAQHAADVEELANAQREYGDALAQWEKFDHADGSISPGETIASMNLRDAESQLSEASAAVDRTSASLATLNDRMVATQMAISGGDELLSWLAGNLAVSAGLEQAGASVLDLYYSFQQLGAFDPAAMSLLDTSSVIAVASAYDGTAQSIVDALWSVLGALQQTSPEAAAALQAYLDALAIEPTQVEPAGQAAGEAMGQAAVDTASQTIADGQGQIAESVAAAVGGAVEEASAGAEDSARAVGESAAEGYSGGFSGQATGAESMSDAALGIEEGTPGVEGAAEAAGQSAYRAFGGRSAGYGGGADYALGAAQGIRDNIPVIMDVAATAANSAQWAFDSELGIASPSRAMMESGRYFDEGFAVGIADSAEFAVRQARLMAAAAWSAVDSYDYVNGYSDMAASAASTAHMAAQAATLKYSGPSKADIYDAVSAAIGSNAGTGELAVYIDGRRLASSLARPMDAELGTLASRKGR